MNRARRPGESLMIAGPHLKACGRHPAVDDVRFPGTFEVVTALPGPNRSPESTGTLRVRRRAIRHAAVLEVSGRFSDVVHDLDQAIQLALADRPRGVVCDLTAVVGGAEPVAVEVLATAGRHVREWPGIPVAVATPDPQVREALLAHHLGGRLIVAESLFSAISAISAVGSTPTLAAEWLHLAPHPTSLRTSRDLVTRTLLDWRLGRVIRFARLVVGELVMSSTVNACSDIDLSVEWNLGALRLTVRDHGRPLPDQQSSALDLHGRGLAVVAGLSRAFGVLPTTDGGKVGWAVLNAPVPRQTNSPGRLEAATATQGQPSFADARGLPELAFCAGSRRHSPDTMSATPGADHTSGHTRARAQATIERSCR